MSLYKTLPPTYHMRRLLIDIDNKMYDKRNRYGFKAMFRIPAGTLMKHEMMEGQIEGIPDEKVVLREHLEIQNERIHSKDYSPKLDKDVENEFYNLLMANSEPNDSLDSTFAIRNLNISALRFAKIAINAGFMTEEQAKEVLKIYAETD